MIGASVHSVDEAVQREKEGANFVVLGPIYDTPSKRPYGEPLGTSILQDACQRCQIPIFAIGGISLSRVPDIQKTGAFGIAVISSIFRAAMPAEIVKNYTTQLGVSP